MLDFIKYPLILGKGKSGLAAKNLLESKGIKVCIVDDLNSSISDFKYLCLKENFTHCIVSPGFSSFHPWIEILKKNKIKIITEIELGWTQFNSPTIAVTGSNGKSTALKWLYETFKLAGQNVVIGGNYGIPISELAMKNKSVDWLLVEISSFQLELASYFSPDIAVILNILPNHLDRHKTIEQYTKIKCKIFGTSQNPSNICIIPFNQKDIIINNTEGLRKWITFGLNQNADISITQSLIKKGNEKIIDLKNTIFNKGHLRECTSLAVAAIINQCNIKNDYLKKSSEVFVELPHRLEKIAEFNGISFINDSKSTNLAATIAAVKISKKPVRLLIGGRIKENNISFLKEKLAHYDVCLYSYGESAKLIKSFCSDSLSCSVSYNLSEAFKLICNDMKKGDTILLSPGCSSFDQFSCFEERGDFFKSLVEKFIS